TFMLPDVPFVFTGKLIPNAPDDLFAALGKNDQKIHVVPSKGWVVVRQGEAAGGPNGNLVPVVFDTQLWARLNTLVCNPTAVQETAHNPEIKIQPNPAGEAWTITSAASIERIELYHSAGQPAYLRAGLSDTTHRIEAAELPAGVYYLKIWSAGSLQVRSLMRW
ncbi:MAG: T9SS type A sorting domain-containing protein, partial [Saprospiraceae bacterium]